MLHFQRYPWGCHPDYTLAIEEGSTMVRIGSSFLENGETASNLNTKGLMIDHTKLKYLNIQ